MQVKSKYIQIRDDILCDIRKGKYCLGQRLPSERMLAEEYGVSHMTARRAITDMVETELLVRRDREGIFLQPNALELLHLKNVNLICSSYEAPIITEFLRLGGQYIEAKGGRSKVLRVSDTQMRPAVKVVTDGHPCLILSDDSILKRPEFVNAMQSPSANVVLVGNDLSMLGISSVESDDALSMRMTVDMLKSKGHSKIAFIAHNLEHPTEKLMANTWASCFAGQSEDEIKSRLLLAPTPPYESCSDFVFDSVGKYLKSGGDVTAYICQLDEAVLGAMAACRAAGLKIPGDVSFVSAIESPITRYMNPPVTVIGPDMASHIEAALELLGQPSKGELKLIKPKLVMNESVANMS